ncbi:MAG: 30S ribosomal protein S3 [Parcubacteria group bacterium Gr01-1014_44]|nr:MAG: 30S ribosomal protein S3 [Parcubacteria group bacterium Gr01-1014_44]
MGQKISPTSFRLSFNKEWRSRWFGLGKKYTEFFREDYAIRTFLDKKLKNMSVDRIEIERSPDVLNIIIHTARPGLIIGRGGTGAEDLRREIQKKIKRKTAVKIDIQEFKNPEISSLIMAESVVEQIERRLPFRRVMKQVLSKIMANKREVRGAKLELAGRLNGAEIARTEHLEEGSLPLQTLRAEIDYAKRTAYTTYGTIGVKVWIYKGMRFE